MKRTISLLICIMLIFTFCITAAADNTALSENIPVMVLRAGGGGSSGGSGGSGNSGNTAGEDTAALPHYSDTGGEASPIEAVASFIIFALIFFSSSILFYLKLTKYSRKSKRLMKQLMQNDTAWEYNDISRTVNECYFAVQTAWSETDMTNASQYMSDDLYKSFQTKLSWMKYRNQKNILKDISLIHAFPIAVQNDDKTHDCIWFYIKGRMTDYTIDTITQSIISGKTFPASFEEFWQFTRKDNRWVLNKILQKNESDRIPFNN